jgi:hypothetical protein
VRLDHLGQRERRLGALHSEPILAQRAPDGPKRLAAALRALACAVLDAPPG